MSKAIVFLADGLEECEGLLVVDLLRRAGVTVETASVNGTQDVVSSHRIPIRADVKAEEADYAGADLLVLPGGMPGTTNLGANPVVCREAVKFAAEKKIAAICAAPSVFGSLGLLKGKRATVYPGMEDTLVGAVPTFEAVTQDGNIITARALGAAIPFALVLIEQLEGKKTAERVKNEIFYAG